MVMAAGLGTRLRPLTYDVPKPLVPVANRPVMEHILMLLRRHGFGPLIANLHWFPETIRDRFGDGSGTGVDLTYSYEDELLGTAGGVRNVAEFFGDEPFLVMAADALTDIDLAALRAAHEANDGIATLAVKRVSNVTEFGVVVTDSGGRIQGFQEKPDPAEALSDLASCMIYVLEREIFDYFPSKPVVDFAREVFPALLSNDVPFYVHEIDSYWNDVGSLPEYLQGNLDAVEGGVEVEPRGTLLDPSGGDEALERGDPGVSGRVLVGEGCDLDPGSRLDGPLVIGGGCRIGSAAQVKESVLLPGSRVAEGALVAGAIYGQRGAVDPGS
jgi:mannose-1-phosphate guanylyltransferase/mannose-1-phosphate guanylyltransferase/phosphomannomutase